MFELGHWFRRAWSVVRYRLKHFAAYPAYNASHHKLPTQEAVMEELRKRANDGKLCTCRHARRPTFCDLCLGRATDQQILHAARSRSDVLKAYKHK